ncbi:hypothetical protein BH09ACT6_BH09ACT6_05090 [soil metagenome]
MAESSSSVAVVDGDLMRRAMAQFASGVTVITTLDGDGQPVGCTMSAFSSLSLDPPLVLICVGKDRNMAGHLSKSAGYVVNILGVGQDKLALNFAGRNTDRFSDTLWEPGLFEMPRLLGVICNVECRLWSITDGGDHLIVIGEVVDVHIQPGTPLLHSQGSFNRVHSEDSMPIPPQFDEWLCSAPW